MNLKLTFIVLISLLVLSKANAQDEFVKKYGYICPGGIVLKNGELNWERLAFSIGFSRHSTLELTKEQRETILKKLHAANEIRSESEQFLFTNLKAENISLDEVKLALEEQRKSTSELSFELMASTLTEFQVEQLNRSIPRLLVNEYIAKDKTRYLDRLGKLLGDGSRRLIQDAFRESSRKKIIELRQKKWLEFVEDLPAGIQREFEQRDVKSDHRKVIVDQWRTDSENLVWAISAEANEFCESHAEKRDLELSKEVTELVNGYWKDFKAQLNPEERSKIENAYQLKKRESGQRSADRKGGEQRHL